jgi:putative flippase GtrA
MAVPGQRAVSPEPRAVPTRAPGTATVEIMVPVYNEERALPGCVRTLHRYLTEHFPVQWRITVVDNASTDATAEVAARLAEELPGVGVISLDRKGRGLALRESWGRSEADVVAYMDVDLSTGLDALLPLVAPLLNGHSDIAIGSRLAPGARIVRGAKREVISRCYNALIKLSHGARFSDAQCGFKAARTDVLRALLPHVRDESWFFDTELLLLAEHNELRIHEVPVDWMEDVDTRVDVAGTAFDDLRGLARMARAKADGSARVAGLPRRPELAPTHPDAVLAPAAPARPRGTAWQLTSFGLIGLISTAVTVALYALLREAMPPLAANLVSLTVTTLLNTEANRRLTFLGSRVAAGRVHAQGLIVFGLYYCVTSGALLLLDALVPGAGRGLEVAVLVAASALGTAGRFVLLRTWVFGRRG